MKIFIEEEYGYAYYLWDYPGSIEELIADYRAGRAPSGVEYDDSMPPKPIRRSGQRYLGTVTAAESVDREQTVGIMYTQVDRCTLWVMGRSEPIYPDLTHAPIGTLAAFERAKQCPSQQSLLEYRTGEASEWSNAWIAFHLQTCSTCMDTVNRRLT